LNTSFLKARRKGMMSFNRKALFLCSLWLMSMGGFPSSLYGGEGLNFFENRPTKKRKIREEAPLQKSQKESSSSISSPLKEGPLPKKRKSSLREKEEKEDIVKSINNCML
jgi:hypothetical protein